MSQGSSIPNPHLLYALEHHRQAQELTAGLYNVVQHHSRNRSSDPELDRLIAPLLDALSSSGDPVRHILQHQEALDTGSTPANILAHLRESPHEEPGLEHALLQHDTLLRDAGNLEKLAKRHQLALDLAQKPPYEFSINPEIRFGKPCIKGCRTTVYDVMEYLASGMSTEEIVQDFPHLTHEDLQTCQAFAEDLITQGCFGLARTAGGNGQRTRDCTVPQ